jgi:sec-independent protein translocase protein TatA
MGPFGWQELVLILVLLLLVFGAGKLPQVGQAIGRAVREVRHAANDVVEPSRSDAPVRRPDERRE